MPRNGEDAVVVRGAIGNSLADGDPTTLIKDPTPKWRGSDSQPQHADQGGPPDGRAQEIDCRYEGIKGLVLRAEFVKKR